MKERKGKGGGVGWALLFNGTHPLPNYCPYFPVLFAPQSFFTTSFFEGHRPLHKKIKHSQYKSDPKYSTKLSI